MNDGHDPWKEAGKDRDYHTKKCHQDECGRVEHAKVEQPLTVRDIGNAGPKWLGQTSKHTHHFA